MTAETPEAKAARLTLAFIESLKSKDDRAPDGPAGEIIVTILAGFLRLTAATEELARVTAVSAKALEEIALELKAAKAFREKERRAGR